MLDLYEFDLIYVGNKFFVQDRQKANLGDIESDAFNNLSDVIDRMEAYHNDYIYDSIEECEDMGEVVSDWDYKVRNLIENSYRLNNINVNKFEEYLEVKNIDKTIFKRNMYVAKTNIYGSTYHLFNDGQMAVIYTDNGSYSIDVIGDIEANMIANSDFADYKRGEMLDHFRGNGNNFCEWLDQYNNQYLDKALILDGVHSKYKLELVSNNWYEVFYDNLDGEQEFSETLDADNLYDAIDEVKRMIKEINIEQEL